MLPSPQYPNAIFHILVTLVVLLCSLLAPYPIIWFFWRVLIERAHYSLFQLRKEIMHTGILLAGEKGVDFLAEVHEGVLIRCGLLSCIFLRQIRIMVELPKLVVDIDLQFLPLRSLYSLENTFEGGYRVPWSLEVMDEGVGHHIWIRERFSGIHVCSTESDVLQFALAVDFPPICVDFGKRIFPVIYN